MEKLDSVITDLSYVLDALVEHKRILQSGCCGNCSKQGDCEYIPNWGELMRYNCPFYKRFTFVPVDKKGVRDDEKRA